MKKKKLKIYLNILEGITFFLSFISGIIIWLILPEGAGFKGGRGLLTKNIFYNYLDTVGWIFIIF